MDWLQGHQWEVWLCVAILLLIGEMFTLDLFLAMLAAGALAGMLSTMLTGSWVVQGGVALVVAVAMLAVVRPSLVRRLHRGEDLALGNDRLVGLVGRVSEPIRSLQPGRVAVDGEIWTASADADLPVGTTVEVVEIRGATAHVRPAAAHRPGGPPSLEEN